MADSKTWKYRAAIQELKKLQEEFDFLAAYRIQDKAQLKAISDATKEQLWENSRARKQLRKEMLPYEEMLLLLNKLQEKQMEAELYQEGYQEFFQDHQTYQNLLGQLKEMGYSLSEAEQTDAYFFEKEERLRFERKKILKEKRIAERLREKAEEKEMLEAQQKEKNREPSARGSRKRRVNDSRRTTVSGRMPESFKRGTDGRSFYGAGFWSSCFGYPEGS